MKGLQQSTAFFIGLCCGDDRDIHPTNLINAVIINFWEDELFAQAEQDKRFVTDSWEEKVVRYLNGKAPVEHYPSSMIRGPRGLVTTTEVLEGALRLDSAKHGRPEQTRVGQIMQRIGWKKRRLAPDPDGYRAWVFERPAEAAAA